MLAEFWHDLAENHYKNSNEDLSGGSKGGREGRAPPLDQNFFIFMQVLGKIGQIIGWRPPFGVSAPSSGNSWIRHWTW